MDASLLFQDFPIQSGGYLKIVIPSEILRFLREGLADVRQSVPTQESSLIFEGPFGSAYFLRVLNREGRIFRILRNLTYYSKHKQCHTNDEGGSCQVVLLNTSFLQLWPYDAMNVRLISSASAVQTCVTIQLTS